MTDLVERSEYLDALIGKYQQAAAGEGHTVFLMGEAGIGKTSVVNAFLKQLPKDTMVLCGACDPLSTPRPLGPLYDIANQVSPQFHSLLKEEKKRQIIFSALIDRLAESDATVIVFEDIHWADEATIDLIKFLSRRLFRYRCLFLLTYRDDEMHAPHALKNIFGELIPHTFSKIGLKCLSLKAVTDLGSKHGSQSAQRLYDLTSGNPFYVTEILSNESNEIPDRVKDSVLATFYSKDETTRLFLEFLSILPSRIEQEIVDRIVEDYPGCFDSCLSFGILLARQGHFSFKHELFRITIEESLTPSRRKQLHKKMLSLISENKFKSVSLSQLVHHAQYADERKMVQEMAARAAEESSAVGAHIEASKLYAIAIKYAEGDETDHVTLYERHAYECYLINRVQESIRSQEKALQLWRELKSNLKEGDALRFLSRIWWFAGNRAKAMTFGEESIRILENGFPTRERTLAYSNLAQLYMLSDDKQNSLLWGRKSVDLATRMDDQATLAHALNNVGSVMMRFSDTEKEGEDILRRSLSISLREEFHEHAARAYTNLCTSLVLARRYREAESVFVEGVRYCEDRDLNSWIYYKQSEYIKLLLDTGRWDEAEAASISLKEYPNHLSIVRVSALTVLARLCMRRGQFAEASGFLDEARVLASLTGEAQRIVPVIAAVLELSWIQNEKVNEGEIRQLESTLFTSKDHSYHYMQLAYWLKKTSLLSSDQQVKYTGAFALEHNGDWSEAARNWQHHNCPYEEALALFEGDDNDKRRAFHIIDDLGATATLEKLRSILRDRGIKNIPRGLRKSTKSNVFQLTNRQVDVLHLLNEGLQNAEIAERLFISNKTVDHHISAILGKLDVSSRTKAVSKARQLGLLPK